MTLKDKCWVVGLLEGEGCFTLTLKHYKQSVYRYPKVQLNMTDRDVVERAGRILGSPVCRIENYNGKYKDTFQTSISGMRALRFMEETADLFGERRRARIYEIIELSSGYRQKLVRLGRIKGEAPCPSTF